MPDRGRPSWLLALLGALVLWKVKPVSPAEAALKRISPGSLEARHELTDANARALLALAISMILGAIVMHLGLGAYFFALRRHEPQETIARQEPPQPRLQVNARSDLKAYLDRETSLLNSYGWVDREAKTARIPIERAMELMAVPRE